MNDRFFILPIDKQERIINAAYKVFSQNTYKKASMSEVASEGGISKALLFHYFTNKKELYMYLWNRVLELTRDATVKYQVLNTDDFFEMLDRTLLAKCSLMQKYPHIYMFGFKAYYEQLPEIRDSVQESYNLASQNSELKVLQKIDTSIFRQDIDLKFMYEEIMYAVDGYMLKAYRSKDMNISKIQSDMRQFIHFWKKVYTIGKDES